MTTPADLEARVAALEASQADYRAVRSLEDTSGEIKGLLSRALGR